jgi:hypothetical protein
LLRRKCRAHATSGWRATDRQCSALFPGEVEASSRAALPTQIERARKPAAALPIPAAGFYGPVIPLTRWTQLSLPSRLRTVMDGRVACDPTRSVEARRQHSMKHPLRRRVVLFLIVRHAPKARRRSKGFSASVVGCSLRLLPGLFRPGSVLDRPPHLEDHQFLFQLVACVLIRVVLFHKVYHPRNRSIEVSRWDSPSLVLASLVRSSVIVLPRSGAGLCHMKRQRTADGLLVHGGHRRRRHADAREVIKKRSRASFCPTSVLVHAMTCPAREQSNAGRHDDIPTRKP